MMGRMAHKAGKFGMKLGDNVLKQMKASERKRSEEDCGPIGSSS